MTPTGNRSVPSGTRLARQAGARGLGGDLGHHRPADRAGHDGRGCNLAREPARADHARHGRLEDVLLDLQLQPDRRRDGADGVGGVLVVCTETTQSVLAERRAAEVQEHQRQMLRQMPGFVAMLSGPDLVYTYVNDAYVAISERTDFVGRRFRDVFADIEGQGYFEAFENAFHDGKGVVTRGMELRLHGRADPQYVDFVLEPIRDDSGAVTGLFVGGYETTEIYRGNAALRDAEQRLRLAVENAEVGFWDVDL